MPGITEKEAKDKWCLQTMINCGQDGDGVNTCVASECMAWRISQEDIPGDPNINELGYCGLVIFPTY